MHIYLRAYSRDHLGMRFFFKFCLLDFQFSVCTCDVSCVVCTDASALTHVFNSSFQQTSALNWTVASEGREKLIFFSKNKNKTRACWNISESTEKAQIDRILNRMTDLGKFKLCSSIWLIGEQIQEENSRFVLTKVTSKKIKHLL